MSYLGRATDIHFATKLNGTHTLTFKMPDRFFDSEKGNFVENEFKGFVVNENKVKLHYKNEWFEFFIKTVKQNKQFKSYMYEYSCTDAYIDELSRNGYGIMFDTELYNNVEEIGTFSEEILEGSQWTYMPQYNSGDFTEYVEEKLYRIPASCFDGEIQGYKLNYETTSEIPIENLYTKEKRTLELSDDLARQEKWFWDCYDENKNIKLVDSSTLVTLKPDKYIYVPYSQLDFCYVTTGEDFTNTNNENFIPATERPAVETMEGYTSYLLAPPSIDPTHLIQFMVIPAGAEVEIDEAGLIVNKDFTYVMTVEQWNQQVKNKFWYTKDLNKDAGGTQEKKIIEKDSAPENYWFYNKCVVYDGYLNSINDIEVDKGKKICISDRTELNISEEIDQYVTVYNNKSKEYKSLYSNPDWYENTTNFSGYRVCSKIATRQIIPQLARNYAENATNIARIDGWEVMKKSNDQTKNSAELSIYKVTDPNDDSIIIRSGLQFTRSAMSGNNYNTIINFGAIGQEKTIEKNKTYCVGITVEGTSLNGNIKIGEGSISSDGDYSLGSEIIDISLSGSESVKIGNVDYRQFYVLIRPTITIKNPYLCIQLNNNTIISEFWCFEAYTKGSDFYSENSYDLSYKYSGRELFKTETLTKKTNYFRSENIMTKGEIQNKIIFEGDEELTGDTYEYKQYFIQQLKLKNKDKAYDTFCAKKYLSEDADSDAAALPLSAADFTENDYEIITNYIDLNNCEYYVNNTTPTARDCSYPDKDGEEVHFCMYQKYGYCPYRFKTEKHCRKVRTLTGSKSNRFNLTQEVGKVFETYPIYYIEHNNNGTYKTDESNKPIKYIFYMTEKGVENKIGFRYEKNLADISRDLVSDQIVTKLYVEDNDSDLSRTGLCSIKTAEDNPSKDNFIIDLSYYIKQGMLDKDQVERDLYGVDNTNNIGFLKKLGYYNTEYDKLSDLIINTTNESYTELEANLDTNLTGIETTLEEIAKINKQMDRYKITTDDASITDVTNDNAYRGRKTAGIYNGDYVKYKEEYYYYDGTTTLDNSSFKPEQWVKVTNEVYDNYKEKKKQHQARLIDLIKQTFYSENYDKNGETVSYDCDSNALEDSRKTNPEQFLNNLKDGKSFKEWQETYVDEHEYGTYGMLGQYNAQFNQIQEWKKQRVKYLKDINALSQLFFYRYEPYLKEGTWTDSNYITDNAYYHDALTVAAEGAIPKVTYNIKVTPLGILDEDYEIGVADTSYIEDEGMFGINQKTGLPNRLKVIISEFNESLDKPTDDSITVQNFTTQFEDLFQQVTASVQSLTFNENIYKRSSNFTPSQVIEQASIQGALDTNQLTYLNTSEGNIKLDQTGQSGSDINNHNNKYKLNGQGLYFSNNGGVTWNVGVGPSGINADYINTGTLDAGNIRIVDGSYLYFLWDKGGITAYRELQATSSKPSGTDFARFNKYGLSLVENNRIRLRAGYEFNGTHGNITSETGQGKDIGFYLYDTRGHTIFSTEASENKSARLNLAGEMYVARTIEEAGTNSQLQIFIYNQANSSTKTITSGNTHYYQRLFNIISVSGNTKKNLFSVLADGSLHIGGTINEYQDGTGQDLKHYLDIPDGDNTISLKDGQILLSGVNLKSYVDELKGIAEDAARDAESAATAASESATAASDSAEYIKQYGITPHYHNIEMPEVTGKIKAKPSFAPDSQSPYYLRPVTAAPDVDIDVDPEKIKILCIYQEGTTIHSITLAELFDFIRTTDYTAIT